MLSASRNSKAGYTKQKDPQILSQGDDHVG